MVSAFSIPKASRSAREASSSPGPAAYRPVLPRHNDPRCFIGRAKRPCNSEEKFSKQVSREYQSSKAEPKLNTQAGSWLNLTRRKGLSGQTYYNNYKSLLDTRGGAFSKAQKSSQLDRHVLNRSSNNAVSQAELSTPGPGHYINQGDHSQSKIRFGKERRFIEQVRRQVPGPGEYTPNYDCIKVRNGRVRIACSKAEFRVEDKPGPGAYNLSGLQHSKGVVFGLQRKDKKSQSDSPGPGSYQIKPKFAEVPKYLLPRGPEKSCLYL